MRPRGKFLVHSDELIDADEQLLRMLHAAKPLYEVFRIIDNIPLFWPDHFSRLQNSAKLAGLKWLPRQVQLKTSILKLIRNSDFSEGNIKLMVSVTNPADYYIYFVAHHYPSEADYATGVNVLTLKAQRTNPNAKILNPELRSLCLEMCHKKQVYEVVLVNEQNCLTEGSRSNLFFIQDQNLYTAPSKDVLPGITRKYVIEAAVESGMNLIEKPIPLQSIELYDAIFISGTSPKVLPVRKIDNHEFNHQNIFLYHIMKRYNNLINRHLKENKHLWL